MKMVLTNQLEIGNYAAHVIDLPNAGGIQIARAGVIERVEPFDMWGNDSVQHTTVWMKFDNDEYVMPHTIHNSHAWLVRP